jgi:predicted DNA-binding ribbon-helix-helix protein
MVRTTKKKTRTPDAKILVERVQTGVRLEKRLLKVLKGLAEYHDMTLGDLLEGIVLHAFDGQHPFSAETRQRITDLKRIYKLDLDSSASHRLMERVEETQPLRKPRGSRRKVKR